MPRLTGTQARELRHRNGWSLQVLANLSGINKAYLSEFENGARTFDAEEEERLASLLERGRPVGVARPQLREERGHPRLVFVDDRGNEYRRPNQAFLEWTEDDGTTYRMYIGQR
jgi:transcriptional regulator with XRE-family HTH domain